MIGNEVTTPAGELSADQIPELQGLADAVTPDDGDKANDLAEGVDRLLAERAELLERLQGAEAACRSWEEKVRSGELVHRDDAPKPRGQVVCVVALVTDPADRLLLVRHRERGTWELPGGKKGPAEEWRVATRREALEEAGLQVVLAQGTPYAVLDGQSVPGAAYASTILVVRGRAEGAPTPGDDAAEARWFERHEIPWDDLSRIGSAEVVRAWAREMRETPGKAETTETGYTRAQLADAVDRAHDHLHGLGSIEDLIWWDREAVSALSKGVEQAHEALHAVGAGLPRVGCATPDPEAQAIYRDLEAMRDGKMTCGHTYADLIGGTDYETGRPLVTKCGQCLADRQAERDGVPCMCGFGPRAHEAPGGVPGCKEYRARQASPAEMAVIADEPAPVPCAHARLTWNEVDDEPDCEDCGQRVSLVAWDQWRQAQFAAADAPDGDPLVTVCAECMTASCWYGRFMCGDAQGANTKQVRRSELAKKRREHPENWTKEAIENGGIVTKAAEPVRP